MLFPEPGAQFGDAGTGVLADPLQDINQIVVGINVMEAAGDQQALHNATCLAPSSVAQDT